MLSEQVNGRSVLKLGSICWLSRSLSKLYKHASRGTATWKLPGALFESNCMHHWAQLWLKTLIHNNSYTNLKTRFFSFLASKVRVAAQWRSGHRFRHTIVWLVQNSPPFCTPWPSQAKKKKSWRWWSFLYSYSSRILTETVCFLKGKSSDSWINFCQWEEKSAP